MSFGCLWPESKPFHWHYNGKSILPPNQIYPRFIYLLCIVLFIFFTMENYGRRKFNNNNKILRKWRINVSWGVTLTVGHNGVFLHLPPKTHKSVLECANTREIPYKKNRTSPSQWRHHPSFNWRFFGRGANSLKSLLKSKQCIFISKQIERTHCFNQFVLLCLSLSFSLNWWSTR